MSLRTLINLLVLSYWHQTTWSLALYQTFHCECSDQKLEAGNSKVWGQIWFPQIWGYCWWGSVFFSSLMQAMYIFMAKFEELNKCLAPVQQIAVQMYPPLWRHSVSFRVQYDCLWGSQMLVSFLACFPLSSLSLLIPTHCSQPRPASHTHTHTHTHDFHTFIIVFATKCGVNSKCASMTFLSRPHQPSLVPRPKRG